MRSVAAAGIVVAFVAAAREGRADDAPPSVEIHGFASEGAFVSTANDYIGHSSRGSLELFEAAINVSSQLSDRLRVGLQIFSGNVGTLSDGTPRADWAFFDYSARPWLGLRAGIIKIPFGLYNEFTDIDSARLPILLPQAMYPIRNRDVLISHTGFAVYGVVPLRGAGELAYQAWAGSLTIPPSALELSGATLDEADTRYAVGGQLFYHPPVRGLRIGASVLRASVDFRLTLSTENTAALIAAEVVPETFDGRVVISQRPDEFWVGSLEYTLDDWLFAAEYMRALKHQTSTIPAVLPTLDEDAERFYALVGHQLTTRFEAGLYYSVVHADAGDRRGRDAAQFPIREFAFQRDLAATVRFDVTPAWSWKVEAHFIEGVADLSPTANPDPDRYWGLALVRTTVTF